jgi:cytochrome c-type biogenesis protein CcmH/NrfG
VLDLKRIRPLDAAIAAVAALVILVGGWVAYASWSQNRSLIASTPASRAVDQYVAKVRKNPNDLDARMALAQALVVAGRDREALEQYQQVLKVRKDFVPALSGIGFIYMKRHDWDNGSKYFRRVVTLTQTATGTDRDPNLEVAHFYLGTALMEQKKY